jgi:hypothetical protein
MENTAIHLKIRKPDAIIKALAMEYGCVGVRLHTILLLRNSVVSE